MGTIRMVMLDGLAVADLLALRQGGFFEGAEVRLPSTDGRAGIQLPPTRTEPQAMLANITLTETKPVTDGLPPPAAEVTGKVTVPAGMVTVAPPVKLTAEQQATLDAARAELAEFRGEKAAPVTEAARSEPEPVNDPASAPAVPVISASGLPSAAQLASCTKLRDVLQLLLEGGMAAADLAGYLESMRDQVPLLQRISNISERVARTLSVMGQGG